MLTTSLNNSGYDANIRLKSLLKTRSYFYRQTTILLLRVAHFKPLVLLKLIFISAPSSAGITKKEGFFEQIRAYRANENGKY